MSDNEKALFKKVQKAGHGHRLTYLKEAQKAALQGDVSGAVQHYLNYLKALQVYYEVTEQELSPHLFIQKGHPTEVLVVSKVYWDLALAYDKNPKLRESVNMSLAQFARFSLGFKHQPMNAAIISQHLKKGRPRQRDLFQQAHKKIQTSNRACYVATLCYGADHPRLKALRAVRDKRQHHWPFAWAFGLYDRFSPSLVKFLAPRPLVSRMFQALVARPLILIFLKIFQ